MNTNYKLPEKGTKEYLRRKKKFENIRKRKNPLKKENQHPEIKKKVDFSFSSGSNPYFKGNTMSKSAALQKMYDNYFNNLKKGVTLEELSENLNLDEQKSVESAKTRTIIDFNEEEGEE